MCYTTTPRYVGPLFDWLVPCKILALAFAGGEISPSTPLPPGLETQISALGYKFHPQK